MTEEKEITPIVIDGKRVYTIKQVQIILGRATPKGSISYSGMEKVLNRHNIQRYETGVGLEKYCLADDIEPLLKLRPAK